jgi:hypothetical protein
MALAFLGGGQLEHVHSGDESSYSARLCDNLFPSVRDYCLSLHPWSFALRRSELARLDGDGGPRYQLPADCLRAVRVEDGTPAGADFEIEGGALATAAGSASLLYVGRADEPALWPPAFANALAWSLASVLASSLNNDVRRQQMCQQAALAALATAVNADLGGQRPAKRSGSWVRSRNG